MTCDLLAIIVEIHLSCLNCSIQFYLYHLSLVEDWADTKYYAQMFQAFRHDSFLQPRHMVEAKIRKILEQ